jgi:hypothetical protein
VAKETGLRTGRWISHVFFLMDVQSYPYPLFITDAAINIYPDLPTKRPFEKVMRPRERWGGASLGDAGFGTNATGRHGHPRGGPTISMSYIRMSAWSVSGSTPCRFAKMPSNPPGVTPTSSTLGSVPTFRKACTVPRGTNTTE